ncbi:FIST C-terminal domain-containing protein [Waterburya agarophytonicola K14]|uniref:FIST C-terminal domain-containing protein n=1 Tax=Waterburya agarophytonicola KI4 TaxID=2874699 RepID=A0A964FHK8_9CYAN|nr:FIST N-terminal domain-containing protein [Waterburya agarophytonicola]MCC0179142.1 FIST C-terminal domain-containing protein [Waterburya agarophytonicola KI4]
MFKVVVGHSNDPDSVEAVAEILEQCLESLAEEAPQAGILFAAFDFDHSLILQQIKQQFPDLELIGGTSSAEISSRLGYQEDSLTLMLFCSDEIEITAGIGYQASHNPRAAVQQAIAPAKSKSSQEISLCLSFIDGLHLSGSKIVEAIKQELNSKIPVFGGVTADDMKFEQTYQFYDQEVCTDAIVTLIFSGKLLLAAGVGNGWNSLSKPKKVTKAENNILYEIDGQPALEFYQYYLNDSAPSLKYPLAVFENNTNKFYLRVPTAHDNQLNSIQFFGDIPQGATVQIMETNAQGILNSSQTSIADALKNYPGTEPAAAIFFSCVTRSSILGTKAATEYQGISAHLNSACPSIGFYTYGEIAPLQKDGAICLHHETAVSLILGTK